MKPGKARVITCLMEAMAMLNCMYFDAAVAVVEPMKHPSWQEACDHLRFAVNMRTDLTTVLLLLSLIAEREAWQGARDHLPYGGHGAA
jgi:hypothetical protein